MKALATLVLFLAVPMMGQDSVSVVTGSYHFQSVLDSSMITTVGGDTIKRFSPYSAVTIATILECWDRYAKECYNDSTFHDLHREGYPLARDWRTGMTDSTRVEMPGANDGTTLVYTYKYEPRYYYSHRSTSFEGFIGWLRKEREDK